MFERTGDTEEDKLDLMYEEYFWIKSQLHGCIVKMNRTARELEGYRAQLNDKEVQLREFKDKMTHNNNNKGERL